MPHRLHSSLDYVAERSTELYQGSVYFLFLIFKHCLSLGYRPNLGIYASSSESAFCVSLTLRLQNNF